MDYRQIGHQVELLVHHRHQLGQLFAGPQAGERPAVDGHLSFIGLDNARQQVQQGGLAAAAGAGQSNPFAAGDGQAHRGQGLDLGIALADVAGYHQGAVWVQDPSHWIIPWSRATCSMAW